MTDRECVTFLQWALPRLRLRWPGFRKVRRQVHKRINRRLGELGLPDVSAYRRYLQSHAAEWSVLDEACRITISRFYRDRGVFDYLGSVVLPELARAAAARPDRQLNVWSAGCGCGEEPYTAAILGESLGPALFTGVRLRILGTDVSGILLERAREGRYPASSLKDVPAAWFASWLVRSGDGYVVTERVRRRVEFLRQDIRHELPRGPLDLVLCRNLVFTYFDESLQREVLRRVVDRIRPGGVLLIGKQESLPERPEAVWPCDRQTGIYRIGHASVCGDRQAAASRPFGGPGPDKLA